MEVVALRFRFIYFIIAVVFTLMIDQWYVEAHEEAHRVIFSYYGVDSEVHMHLLSGETVADANDVMFLATSRSDMYVSLLHAQSMVDAIGYQLEPILVVVTFILMCIMLHLLDPLMLEEG